MLKNLASLTVAFNEKDLIGGCLELLEVEYKLVLVPKKTFSGHMISERDDTERIAKSKGANVIFTDTETEPETRNFGLHFLHALGFEYSLIVDADEYWPHSSQIDMSRIISQTPADAYKADLEFFFKRPNWKIDGMRNNRAIIAIRTDKLFSLDRPRKFSGKTAYINPGIIYHFSYVRRSKKIKEKIESFSHAQEITPKWYKDVYLKFTPNSINFHPVNPEEYPRCIEYELPEEISNKIPNHLWSA